MGKVRGGDLSVRQDGGIPLSDPSLWSQRGRGPPALWNPRPLRAFPPPALVSILIRDRHVAGVSPESHPFASPRSSVSRGTPGCRFSIQGRSGRTRSKTEQAPNGGGGEGAKPSPTPQLGDGGNLLCQSDVEGVLSSLERQTLDGSLLLDREHRPFALGHVVAPYKTFRPRLPQPVGGKNAGAAVGRLALSF